MCYEPVIISTCLLGIKSRYNGEASYSAEAIKEAAPNLIPLCPEQLGGLPTPREPALIVGGTGIDVLDGAASVINRSGQDVTSFFINGAEAVLKIARLTGAKKAVLKEQSPSCGVNCICCLQPGNKNRAAEANEVQVVRKGPGVLAALLIIEGLLVLGF